jgi:CheY-like chemotaxis protein
VRPAKQATTRIDWLQSLVPRRHGRCGLAGKIRGGNLQPAQLLIVEDDDDLRDLLAEQLALSGFSVAQARHGAEALDYLANEPWPRLILLNLVMPVMNGLEFLAQRRRQPRLALIPVFALTGFELNVCRAIARHAFSRLRSRRAPRSGGSAGPRAERAWAGQGLRAAKAETDVERVFGKPLDFEQLLVAADEAVRR